MADILNRAAVRESMRELGLGVTDSADVIGIAPDTLTRILNGRQPDLESLVRIHTGLATAEARARRTGR